MKQGRLDPRPGALTLGLFVVACALTAGLGLAAAEAHARGLLDFIPGAAFAAGAPFALGLAVAAVAAGSLRLGRLPDRAPTGWLAAFAVVVGLAAGWIVRIGPPAEVAQSPLAAIERLVALAAGLPAELILFEVSAAAFAFAAALVLTRRLVGRPLCSQCRTRCRNRDAVDLAPARGSEAARRLRARDWSFFRSLGAPTGRRRLRFHLSACSCAMTRAADLVLRGPLFARTLTRWMRLGSDDVRTVRALARDLSAARESTVTTDRVEKLGGLELAPFRRPRRPVAAPAPARTLARPARAEPPPIPRRARTEVSASDFVLPTLP
jgi:hypothetical protein